eukprot:scaffold10067_cov35-Prasinocladus_malaysianus.AAC.1
MQLYHFKSRQLLAAGGKVESSATKTDPNLKVVGPLGSLKSPTQYKGNHTRRYIGTMSLYINKAAFVVCFSHVRASLIAQSTSALSSVAVSSVFLTFICKLRARQAAAESYQEALKADKDCGTLVYLHLARVQALLGKFDTAVATLKKVEQDPIPSTHSVSSEAQASQFFTARID